MNKEESKKFKELCFELITFKDKILDKSFNSIEDKTLAIEIGVLCLHAGNKNLLYNMKYREEAGAIIRNLYFTEKEKNSPNGVDLYTIPECECKSATVKSKKINIYNNMTLGEIDKVYNKINDSDPKYATNTKNHVIFSIFRPTNGFPAISFYIDNVDFGKVIQPLLNEKNNELILKTNNLKIKSRDSLIIKLEHFLNCQSLDIAYIDRNEDNIYITNQFLSCLDKKSKIYKSIKLNIDNGNINII